MKVRIWGFNHTTEWPSVTAWTQDIVLCGLLHRHDVVPPERPDLMPHCARCGAAGAGLGQP